MMRRALGVALGAVVAAEAALLLTDRRVLVRERLIQPGAHVVVPGYGDVAESAAPPLMCQ